MKIAKYIIYMFPHIVFATVKSQWTCSIRINPPPNIPNSFNQYRIPDSAARFVALNRNDNLGWKEARAGGKSQIQNTK